MYKVRITKLNCFNEQSRQGATHIDGICACPPKVGQCLTVMRDARPGDGRAGPIPWMTSHIRTVERVGENSIEFTTVNSQYLVEILEHNVTTE